VGSGGSSGTGGADGGAVGGAGGSATGGAGTRDSGVAGAGASSSGGVSARVVPAEPREFAYDRRCWVVALAQPVAACPAQVDAADPGWAAPPVATVQ